MRPNKTITLAALVGAIALAPLYADEWDKKTIITINAPVQIPSTTLQPGTYTLKLMDSSSDRHIVTVWDKEGMHLITTVLAIPNYRLKPTDKSRFTFWETAAGEPAAMRAWFYPGDNFGQEFAYPKAKAQQLSLVSHTDVPYLTDREEAKMAETHAQASKMETTAGEGSTVTGAEPLSSSTTSAESTTTSSSTSAVESSPSPAPASTSAAASSTSTAAEPTPAPSTTATAPATAPEQAPTSEPTSAMPTTASNTNELIAFGLLLSLTGLSTFLVRNKRA